MNKSHLLSWVTCVWVLGAGLTGGCIERKTAPLGPNVGYGQEVEIGGPQVSAVDVLFVIDNSGSMSQEQTNLARQIPALVRDLASPPDRDGDGAPDWNPAEELRIGVVTTDVGTGSTMIDGSHCMAGGEDGALRGGVFEWSEGDDPDAFAERVRTAVGSLGIVGCAFEQPLEAAARAIEHAPDTGFPSDDGLLAVIIVTDEEDCSVDDDDTFFAPMQPVEYNVYCGLHADQLTSVDELIGRIRGPRSEQDFIFAAITGVPVDTAPDADLGALLASPQMQFRPDGAARPEPVPVCGSDLDLGKAQPARRLVQLAQRVPGSVVTTICTDDFGPAIDEIGARIGARIPGLCLVRDIPAGAGSGVPCQVSVWLPRDERCEGRPGYSFSEVREGRELCNLEQTPGGVGSGFYYDPDHEECAQLVITDDAVPPIGASVRAECFFPLLSEIGELCARSSQCATGYCDPITDACAELPETPGTTGG